MRVFISSTCYDLIDLRAELEVFFREAGVEPVMSGSLTSGFQVLPDANSIQTCLANVRTCDHFLIILSARYGPPLGARGFPDVSATHLEYLEAREAKIPIHMFVRDKLEGDFDLWKKSTDRDNLQLSWCSSKADWKLFDLMKAHRHLDAAGGNNWFWTFRHSIELKDRLRLDFKGAFANATVRALFDSGNLPLIEVLAKSQLSMGAGFGFSLTLRNVGQATAISPVLAVSGTQNSWTIKTLHPKEEAQISTPWAATVGESTTLRLELAYSTVQGYKFVDDASVVLWATPRRGGGGDTVSYTFTGRRYLGASDAPLLEMPTFST